MCSPTHILHHTNHKCLLKKFQTTIQDQKHPRKSTTSSFQTDCLEPKEVEAPPEFESESDG